MSFQTNNKVPFPKLTPPAKKSWEQIPEQTRRKILENVWCSRCRVPVKIQLRAGEMAGRSLVLSGTCMTCGSEVARVLEPVEE
jgi:hypothetical protein